MALPNGPCCFTHSNLTKSSLIDASASDRYPLDRNPRDTDVVDRNVVELCGRVATDPDVSRFGGSEVRMRILLTTRTEQPRTRIDVLPVVIWDPSDDLVACPPSTGTRIRVRGRLQRQVWDAPQGLRSRLEVVGLDVEVGGRASER